MVKNTILLLGIIYLAVRLKRLEGELQDYFDSLLLRDIRMTGGPDEYIPFSELLKEFNVEIPGIVDKPI